MSVSQTQIGEGWKTSGTEKCRRRWHITTGPAAILWDPAKAADGNFRIESEIYLFDTVRFSVNGAVVASLPRGHVLTDGTVGFRVNHSVNIHITTLDVTSRIP
jgi:hypothetical protein